MTVPTQPVTVNLADYGGPAIDGVEVSATMSAVDMTADGIVVSTKVVKALTVAGVATLQCFPNAIAPIGLGTKGTTTTFRASMPGSKPLIVEATVPNAPCNLVDIGVVEEPSPAPPDLVRAGDLAVFAQTASVDATYAKKTDVDTTYAKKTDLPDLTPYAQTATVDATYAKKTELPDLAPYATLTGAESLLNKVLENPAGKTQTLTDGATITWDTDAGQIAFLTLSTVQASRTLANPTNFKPGALYALVVDNPNGYEQIGTFGNAIVPITSLSVDPAIGARTVLLFFSNATTLFGVNPAVGGSGGSATNRAPVNTVPGAEPVAHDTPYVFSTANGNAISVADPDGTPLTTTLSVTSGTLTAVTGTGASITGNGTASVTIAGPVPQINGALDGLTFTPASGFSGGVTLTVLTDDGTGGGTATDTDTIALTVAAPAGAPVTAQFEAGVNLSGMEWSDPNVRYGTSTYPNINYTVPRAATIAYLAAQGVTFVRLPITWEMLQPVLADSPANSTVLDGYTSSLQATFAAGDFWEPYAQAIDGVLDACAAAGIKCLIDVHNYCRYKDFVYQPDGSVIGFTRPTDKLYPPYTSDGAQVVGKIFANASTNPTLTQAHFTDLWERIATRWKDHAGLGGYGLMNEPNSMPTATTNTAYNDPFVTGNVQDYTIWPSYAQAAVTAIRAIDGATPIFVMGNEWGNPVDWPNVNPGFPLVGTNIVYEFHEYLDHKNSGHLFDWDTEVLEGYSAGEPSGTTISTATGTNRLQPLLTWAAANGNPVLVCGEFGIPVENLPDESGIDQRWLDAADATLATFKANNIRVFTWMGGDHYAIHGFPINHVPKLHQGKTVEPIAGAYLKKQLGTNSATLFDEGGQWSAAGSAVTVKVQARGNLTAPVELTVASDNGGTFSKTTLTLAAGVNSEDSYTFTPVANKVSTITYTRTGGGQVPPARVVYSLTDPVAYASTDLTAAAKAILAKYSASCWLAKDALSEYLNPVAAAAGDYIRGISDSGSGSTVENPMEAINWFNQDPGSLRGTQVPAVFNNDPNGYPAADFTIYGRRGLMSRKVAPWVSQNANDDDYQHPAVKMPFGMTDDHFMVTAFSPTVDPTTGTLMAASEIYAYDTAHNRAGQHSALQVNAGKVQLEQVDAAGTNATIADAASLTVNALTTASFVSTQGAQKLRVNGTQVATGAATFAASNFSAATLGYGYWAFYPADAIQGYKYGYVMGKGNPSDAEMGVLEDYLHAAAQTAADMLLGINLATPSTYSGAVPFSNMMWNATLWSIESETNPGTTQWDMSRGVLNVSAVTGTVVFRASLYDATYFALAAGNYMPKGTYTVQNPNGSEIGIGAFSDQGLMAYSTAASNSFDFRDAVWTMTKGMFIHLRVTAPGTYGAGVKVLIPGADGSDYFNPQFISFLQGLGSGGGPLRFMDWMSTNTNYTIDWADRALTTDTSFRDSGGVPWEVCFDLCNRLNRDPWCNIPPRASTDYVTQWATLAKASLAAGRKPWMERGNEVWNTASAFYASTTWIQYINHTRVFATVDPSTGIIYSPGHSLTSGAVVLSFGTRTTQRRGITGDTTNANSNYWTADRGVENYAQVVDADHIKLFRDAGFTTQVTFPPPNNQGYASSSVTDLIYIVRDEAGKTVDLNANYSQRCIDDWNAADAVYGNSIGAIGVLGSWNAQPSYTTSRLANAGTKARANYVTTAPYFNGWWVGGAVDVSPATFAPKMWTSDRGTATAHVGVYAQGSTPTDSEVVAGTGTGFVAHTSYSLKYGSRISAPATITNASPAVVTIDAAAPTAGSTLTFTTTGTLPTGLAAGTTYYVVNPSGKTFQVSATNGGAAIATTSAGSGSHTATISYGSGAYIPGPPLTVVDTTAYTTCWVYIDSSGYRWRFNQDVTASGSGTVNVFDTFDNQHLRHRIDIGSESLTAQHIANISAAGSSAKYISYEGGMHNDESAPSAVQDWFRSACDDVGFGLVMQHYLQKLAALGAAAFCWYKDIDLVGLTWKIADNYTDTLDQRYLAFAGFNGSVPVYTNVAPSNITAPTVATAPGTLPYDVQALPDPTWTYTIISGNEAGNYDISGGVLRMINTTGIDFGTVSSHPIHILATDGHTDGQFDVTVSTGSSTWFLVSDLFAWNSVADTDTVAINPDRGSVIPQTIGASPATASGGFWNNGNIAVYNAGSGTTASVDTTTGDFLIMQVLKDGAGNFNAAGVQLGTTPFVRPSSVSGTMRYSFNDGTNNTANSAGPADATARVYWLHFDHAAGTVRAGNNLNYVTGTSAAGVTPANPFPSTISANILVDKTAVAYGSCRVLGNRTITQSDVMNEVQKMMTLHGL